MLQKVIKGTGKPISGQDLVTDEEI